MDADTQEAQAPGKHYGRPTKYKPTYCKQIIKFFDIEPYIKAKKTFTPKNGATITEEVLIPNPPVFLVDFAKKIGVTHDTLIEWTKVHPAFSEAYAHAKRIQENIIAKNGLLKLYDGNFAFKTLVNTAGWRGETKTVEITATLEDRLAGLLTADAPKQIEGTAVDAED